jgi:uncharacterized protein (DUF2141 family)
MMSISRKIKTSLVYSFFYFSSVAVSAQANKQTIFFTNIENTSGKIYIALYNKEADFPKKNKIFISKVVDVNGESQAVAIFDNLTTGTYAIAAFLDENGNGKMDTNFLGIPKEKYGFSNNARSLMRAANFKEASFIVDKENTISIKLK